MKPKPVAVLWLIAAAFVFLPAAGAQDTSKIDAAFDKFWAAKTAAEAEHLVDDVIRSGVTFDDAQRRLKAGRTYTSQRTGIVMLRNRARNGVWEDHFYALNIPKDYDPSRK